MDWKAQLDAVRGEMIAQAREVAKAAEARSPGSVRLTKAEMDALDSAHFRDRHQTVKVVGVDAVLSYSDHYRGGAGVVTTYTLALEPVPVPEGHWAVAEVKEAGRRVRYTGSYEAVAAAVIDAILYGGKLLEVKAA